MTTTDPFEPFDRIREAIERVIKPLGVEFLSWNIAPGDGQAGDERICSILMEVTEAAFLSDEDKETRKIFDEMTAEEKVREHEEKIRRQAEANRQALLDLPKGGGIFPEDVPPEA